MKTKIIFSISIFLFIVRLLVAQQKAEVWLLENPQPPQNSQYFQASKKIGLLPGFSSSPFSGNSFRAEIDPFMIIPGFAGNITGGTSDNNNGGAVGTIPVTINVNDYGSSQIDIPIHLPPGIASMMPELSFAYNSLNGDGIMGVGWTIGGLSKISRVPKSFYYNEITGEAGFAASSQLTLDGTFLIQASNGTYYPEQQDFSVIKAVNTSNIDEGFKVLKANGLVYEYGVTADSRHLLQTLTSPIAWYLSRITDAFGNYIEFAYVNDKPNGSFYPDYIRYTGNSQANSEPMYEVRFIYNDNPRTDTQKKYFSNENTGGAFYSQVTKLLESVDVKYIPDDDLIIKYWLSYLNGGLLPKKLLRAIEPWHYESKSASTLNPLWIEWENSDYNLDTRTIPDGQVLLSFPGETVQKGLYSAHFKNKNTTDLVHFGANTTNNNGVIHVYENLSGKYESDLSYTYSSPVQITLGEVKTIAIVDVDGDGLNEIACVTKNGSYLSLILLRVDLESTSNAFTSEVVIPNIPESYWPFNNNDMLVFADFSGNGLTDIAYIQKSGFTSQIKSMRISEPGAPFSNEMSPASLGIDAYKQILIGDFYGKGKSQVLILSESSSKIIWLNGTTITKSDVPNGFSSLLNNGIFTTGDFNGDGKSDLLYLPENGNKWYFQLSKGIGAFAEPIEVLSDNIGASSFNRIFADLNNDGFTDISYLEYENVEIDNIPYLRYYRTDYLIRADDQIKVVKKEMKDANGNRIPIDEVRKSGSNHWQYLHHCIGNFSGSSPSQIMFGRVYINPAQPGVPKLKTTLTGPLYTPFLQAVSKITNGLGAISSFEYTPHSYQNLASAKNEIDIKSEKYNYPVQRFRSFMNVVTKLKTETSQGVFKTVGFNFFNPVYHSLGKGLLGFEKATRFDGINATISQNEYNFENSYFHRELVHSSLYSTSMSMSSLIQQTTYSTNFRNYPEYNFRIFYPYYSSIIKQSYELNSTQAFKTEKTTMSIPDQYGNHQNISYEFGTGSSLPYKITRTMTYDNFVNPNRRFIGLLKKEINDYRLDAVGEAVVRTIDYVNNPATGYRTQKTFEQGNIKALTETYTPDLFGNTVTVEMATSGYASRITNTTFTDDGRFPLNVTNAQGHIKSYEFYSSNGRMKSETDENGRQTQYFYDFFGDLTKTVHYDNTQTVTVKRWVKPSSPHPDEPEHGFPVYFVITQSSGQSAVCTFFDQNNRPLRELRTSYSGEKIYKDFHYFEDNEYETGLLSHESLPYIANVNKPDFITYKYDYLRRMVSTVNPNGSTENITRNGLIQQINQFDGQSKEIVQTAAGLIDHITDNGSNIVNYKYFGDGKVKKTTQAGLESTAVTYMYDAHRNLSVIQDPALGLIIYDYNAFGDLVLKWDSNHQTLFEYDKLSRLTNRTGSDGISTFTWDDQQNGIGLPGTTSYLPSVGTNPSVTESFEYDQFGRPTKIKQSLGGSELDFSYTYDAFGRRKTITYPSGVVLTNMYDENGSLRYIMDKAGIKLWEFNTSDAFNKITQYTLGGQIEVLNTYGATDGLIRTISAQNDKSDHFLLNMEYDWFENGNLMYRKDINRYLSEEFTYDAYNRLKTISFNQEKPVNVATYNENGNIETKVDAGAYYYNIPSRPYAVATIVPVPGSFPPQSQNISHTAFNKVENITEGNFMLSLNYGPNHERILQNKLNLLQGTQQQTRYFTPLYEVVDEDDSQKLIHYFSSPTGIFAIFTIENENAGRMNYVLKDHQGSLAALVNEKSGTEYFSFDAWGRRRNAQTWTYTNMPISFGTTRGFTMHEHLDEFKLINMNGRVYDPLVGRFISPDPFVQMPDYSQSYNRYSYAFNNPLRFSDPSGFFAEGDSTIRPTAELPFLPAKTKPSYRPKASTNTDNTSLGSGVKESETTLPIPYLQSKLSNDAEENADKKSEKNVQEGMSVNPARAYWHYKFGNGNDYHVDISQVDWTMLSAKNFPDGVGSTRQINIFNIKPLSTAGLVFGDIRLQYLGNNHIKVADVFGYGALAGQPYFDTYNFNVRWGEVLNGQNLSRNINTGIGWIGVNMPWHPLLFNTYGGNHYKFIFHGTGIIGGGQ